MGLPLLIFMLAAAEPPPPPPLPAPPVPGLSPSRAAVPSAPPVGIPYAPPSPPPPGRGSLIVGPQWARKPNGEALARFYPDRATRLEREGSATIQCIVDAGGLLTACEIIAESPRDFGFGEAALKMSRLFKLKPLTRDGQPVAGASVRIPLVFRLPDPGPPLDLVTPLSFDEAVMCHTVFARQARYLRRTEAKRWQAAARALALRLGGERGYSARTVGKWLKQAIETGLYGDDRRCEMISRTPMPPALGRP